MPLMQNVATGAKSFILCSFIFFSTVILGGMLYVVRADTADLNLILTITMPPQCSFNNGTSVSFVNFDEVKQEQIDGVSYKRMPIDVGLSCAGLEKNSLNMTLSWPSVTLDGMSAVSTNRTNLGIAIYRDNTRLGNGVSINFTYGSPPNLYAGPVKPSGVMLTDAGAFAGMMTITLNYQ